MKKSFFIAATLLLAVFSIFFAGCKQQPAGTDTVSVGSGKCVKKEAYTVQIPYNDTDYEWVEECLDKNGPYCKETTYTEFDLKANYFGKKCDIKITNRGNVIGDWTLRAKFITTNAGGGPMSLPQTKYIKAGETVLFEFFYDGADTPSSCTNVNDVVPTEKVCTCSFIGKKRVPVSVTKYNTETRYRDVTVDC
ncbi:hypothetical protein COV19_03030 [Candidatus Woesearchaeota archaeon CG10_big_fil_rev_8_21_14_0_10_44_13]|nr:MAG: hypothetical protein COV19_03030 [Candidatus Woesearchaeota archaeon CG10_big_fil_rev_8_21_14_0_10_44_13]